MRMASRQFDTVAVAGRGRQAGGLVRACMAAVYRWYGHRTAVRYLQNADERILRDIGIGRSDILSVVYGRADRVVKRHDYR